MQSIEQRIRWNCTVQIATVWDGLKPTALLGIQFEIFADHQRLLFRKLSLAQAPSHRPTINIHESIRFRRDFFLWQADTHKKKELSQQRNFDEHITHSAHTFTYTPHTKKRRTQSILISLESETFACLIER